MLRRAASALFATRGDPARGDRPPRWDYIALGHYHVYRAFAPNAFYTGSLDYTSTNRGASAIEEERAGLSGKGIIEHDLATGTHTFHPSRRRASSSTCRRSRRAGSRPRRWTRASRRGRVRARAGSTTRSCASSCATCRATSRASSSTGAARAQASRAALPSRHARPEIIRRRHGAPGRRPSLADFVRDKLRERMAPPGVDRDALVDLGLALSEGSRGARQSPPRRSRRARGVDAAQQPSS